MLSLKQSFMLSPLMQGCYQLDGAGGFWASPSAVPDTGLVWVSRSDFLRAAAALSSCMAGVALAAWLDSGMVGLWKKSE